MIVKPLSKLILFLNIILISGCRKLKELQFNNNYFEAQSSLKYEAKLFDIPIPIGKSSILKDISENSYSFFLNSKLVDLISFYNFEMESYGWKKIAEFSSFETLLIFVKPNDRYVSVSIRPENTKNEISKIRVVILLNNYC